MRGLRGENWDVDGVGRRVIKTMRREMRERVDWVDMLKRNDRVTK